MLFDIGQFASIEEAEASLKKGSRRDGAVFRNTADRRAYIYWKGGWIATSPTTPEDDTSFDRMLQEEISENRKVAGLPPL